jgi:hypothetical protein
VVEVVLERCLRAERVPRPVARVEAPEERAGRAAKTRGERSRCLVSRCLRVPREREGGLELRVQDDKAAEAVEPDPGPGRDREDEPARDRAVRALRCLAERGVAEAGARDREALREGRLRHPGRPRRRPAPVREEVLEDGAAAARNEAGREGARERCSLAIPPGAQVRVQRGRVPQRVELEPVAGPAPIEDAVAPVHVGSVTGEPAGREVRRVPLEHAEERQRAGRVVPARLQTDEREDAREGRVPRAGKQGEDGTRAPEDLPVARGLGPGESPGRDRAAQARDDRARIVARPCVDDGERAKRRPQLGIRGLRGRLRRAGERRERGG